GPSQPTYPG
nr:Chain A, Pancreatic hormone [synthetic construct]2H3T_A Chain A, Pancreatic hormone [synthetic construct]2H4B_A Chain A, Pancreatic hormone [synthetic construct]2H4B_B Chain B, Pancreatic hormone [synthetic construct]